MKCRIVVNMDNAAFEIDPFYGLGFVVRRGLADLVDYEAKVVILRDGNGNDVGTLTIEED